AARGAVAVILAPVPRGVADLAEPRRVTHRREALSQRRVRRVAGARQRLVSRHRVGHPRRIRPLAKTRGTVVLVVLAAGAAARGEQRAHGRDHYDARDDARSIRGPRLHSRRPEMALASSYATMA